MIYVLLPLALIALVKLMRFAVGFAPLRWRRNRSWDYWMCAFGYHRLLTVCAEGCCTRCIRCEPEIFKGVRDIRELDSWRPPSVGTASTSVEDDFFV